MVKVPMRDIAIQLLTPNDTLDVRLFDTQGRMHSDVRSRLLAQAEYAIDAVVNCLPGFEVKDIVLSGSCNGYFYHENSDIDLKIIVSNVSNPYITTDDKKLDLFMQMRFVTVLEGCQFRLDKQSMDVSFTTGKIYQDISAGFVYGVYSICEDKWLIKPDKNIVCAFDVDDIMEEYTKCFYDICAEVSRMIKDGKTKTTDGIDEIEDYYKKISQVKGNSMREYIIFKLLKRRGIFKEIISLFQTARQELLSLKD